MGAGGSVQVTVISSVGVPAERYKIALNLLHPRSERWPTDAPFGSGMLSRQQW